MLSSTHTHKRIEAEKNDGKDRKALYKLMNNGKLKKQNPGKTCEKRNRLFKMEIQTKPYVT